MAGTIIEADTDEQAMSVEVVSYGEPLIGIYPPEGCSIVEEKPLSKTWGGDTSNFALALTKLGHTAAYCTRIGAQEFGSSFVDLWKTAGVDISLVQVDKDHPTGLYFISYEGKKHQFLYYRKNSAACFVDPEAINWELVREARVLHLSSISQGISRNALEVSFRLMEFARSHGLRVSYDINYRPPIWNRETARAVIRHTIAEYTDILQMTDDELKLLGWAPGADDFIGSLPRTPDLVALKKGEKGCILIQGGQRCEIEPFSVKVADTVGAGDAFDAGLIAGVLEDLELEALGRQANAVAALTCCDVGPLRAQPYPEAVHALLHR